MNSCRVLTSLAVVVATASCGSTGSYTVGGVSTPTPTGSGATIEIVGQQGASSFSPNPASVASGATVVWHNDDTTTHHIVFDTGALDTGTIAPGASSPAMTVSVPTTGIGYHCSIHPTMVGTIFPPTP
jgi:plastocyanin